MARTGKTISQLALEIERQMNAKKDYLAPVEKLALAVEAVGGAPVPVLALTGAGPLPINELAHEQIAEFTGIPMAYYRRMVGDDPRLLASNVNRWLKDKEGGFRRLVRTLDGNVRAFLSDGYRRIENEDLADAVLPVLQGLNVQIISCEITERRLYIKAVDGSIEQQLPRGRFMGDGQGHQFYDVLSPAITIGNSEVGHGSFYVEAGVWTRACTNLATFGVNMRKYHAGARAEASADVQLLLTDETKSAQDKALWLQARDMVRGAFDKARFDAHLVKLGAATKDAIQPEAAVEVVERAKKKFSWLESERKGILAKLIGGNDLSRYGLHAAVTEFSQSEDVPYDRATELERLGGTIIELPKSDWNALVAA